MTVHHEFSKLISFFFLEGTNQLISLLFNERKSCSKMPIPSVSSSKCFSLGMTVGTQKSQIRLDIIRRIAVDVINL